MERGREIFKQVTGDVFERKAVGNERGFRRLCFRGGMMGVPGEVTYYSYQIPDDEVRVRVALSEDQFMGFMSYLEMVGYSSEVVAYLRSRGKPREGVVYLRLNEQVFTALYQDLGTNGSGKG
jgi:hypothetical protein